MAQTTRTDWDFVVIGGGTAGLVASRTAASLGASTVLIERARLGGDCLWTGCVPSKSLIAAASSATAARSSSLIGRAQTPVPVDFAAVMRHVHAAMERIAPVDSAESLNADGVKVITGSARFTGERTLDVDGRSIRFGQALIATGGSPVLPPLDTGVEFLTSETLWDITELPGSLLVIGGGAIGCEIAQAMARLGSRVTLVQRGPRLLPKEEPRASAIIRSALEVDGVTVHTSRRLASIDGSGRTGTATLDDGTVIAFDAVLAAAGRTPNSGSLDAAKAGVRLDDRRCVIVDAKLRTSNPRVWAAGDVTPLPQFTHTAGVNGSTAATNAVLGLSRAADTTAIPRVTFTHPEVASVGLVTADVAAAGLTVRTIEHHELDRAIAEDETGGFTSLLVDRRGRVRGVTIVGPRAGETLGEASLAVRNGITTSAIASTTHAYPTFNDAFWNAAVADVRERVGRGAIGAGIGLLRRLRSARLR
ncbi:MAG: FAD-dependent oxidoreductase [Burkholderiaceae bacterium]|nr:FAD-dependent oxidoreductase [Microbacteriaceae bacterium]